MKMTKTKLVTEIKDALEDVVIYQNQRSIKTLSVVISNYYKSLEITSDDLVGVPVTYSHLSAEHKFKVVERTDAGLKVLK